MSKPYIVCYMMTSVDGRIDCEMTAKLSGVEEYYPLLDELNLKTAVSGRTTAKLELALNGQFDSSNKERVNREVVSKKADNDKGYSIVIDTNGTLLWNNDEEYEQPHIIVTSQKVTKDYLEYLDSKNISYIVTGEDKIDLKRACEILNEDFNIERMGVVGGPAINTSFLDLGLLDEVIVLIGAGIDGRASYPPVFNRTNSDKLSITKLKLVDVKAYDSGAVLIRYKTH